VDDLKGAVSELAQMMEEFGLTEAKLKGEDWSVSFSRLTPAAAASPTTTVSADTSVPRTAVRPTKAEPAKPKGTPINSPMMGIFFTSPSPGAPPFVKEGDTVTAGQVVGLIEAMKVFNEITATVSGTVTAIPAESGRLVQPGDPLLYIA